MIRRYTADDKASVRVLYSDMQYREPTFSKLDDPHYAKFVFIAEKLLGILVLETSYLTLTIYNIHVSKEACG